MAKTNFRIEFTKTFINFSGSVKIDSHIQLINAVDILTEAIQRLEVTEE